MKTNADETTSENRLSSDDSKNSINLQSLRPMEANIFVSLYEVKAELTKVSLSAMSMGNSIGLKFLRELRVCGTHCILARESISRQPFFLNP